MIKTQLNPKSEPFGTIFAVTLLTTILVLSTSTSALASTTMYSGRATGVSVDSSIADLSLADTGELSSQGGEIDATVLSVNHDLVDADVLLAVTSGFDDTAQSEAATADVVLLPGSSYEITSDFVRSETKAVCGDVSGTSEIVNLKLGENTIQVTGNPNQTIEIPGVLTLVINEQKESNDEINEIQVNALHLTLETGEEIVVSHAKSGILCGESEPVQKDFVTGGGFIKEKGERANFGFVAGFKPGEDNQSGQFNYVDKSNDIHLKSIEITSFDGTKNTRTFSGDATINGQGSFTFTVTVTDNGEPGKNSDSLSIEISNGYSNSGFIDGGNIQLHS